MKTVLRLWLVLVSAGIIWVCAGIIATPKAVVLNKSRSAPVAAIQAMLPDILAKSLEHTDALPANEEKRFLDEYARASEMMIDFENRIAASDKAFGFKQSVIRGSVLKYGYIFDNSNLSPAMRVRLKELLFDREMTRYDLESVLLKQGITPLSAAYKAAYDEQDRVFESKLLEISGTESKKVKELMSLSGRMLHITAIMAPQFDYFGVPLTNDQQLELAYAMKSAGFSPGEASFSQGLSAESDPETGLIPLYKNLASEASGILTPQQLKVLNIAQAHMISVRQAQKQAGAKQ